MNCEQQKSWFNTDTTWPTQDPNFEGYSKVKAQFRQGFPKAGTDSEGCFTQRGVK